MQHWAWLVYGWVTGLECWLQEYGFRRRPFTQKGLECEHGNLLIIAIFYPNLKTMRWAIVACCTCLNKDRNKSNAATHPLHT